MVTLFSKLTNDIKSSIKKWSILKGQVYKLKLSLSSLTYATGTYVDNPRSCCP